MGVGKKVFRLEADNGQAVRSMQTLNAAMQRNDAQFKKMAGSAKKSSGSLKAITSTAAGFINLTAAVFGTVQALRELQQVKEKAAAGILSTSSLLKQLNQISGSKQEFETFNRIASGLQKSGFTKQQALSTVFKGKSRGFTNEQIASVGRFNTFSDKPDELLNASAGLRVAFGPKAAGGSLDANINALLAGAKYSKVNIDTLAENVLQPAQQVKRLGGTANETIAAMSVAAKALSSPEVAATALGRLSDVLARGQNKAKFQGLGLIGALEKLAGFSRSERDAIIGENVRAKRGLVLVENLADVKKTLVLVEEAITATGTKGSRISIAIENAITSEPLKSLLKSQIATSTRQDVAQKTFGPGELQRQAVEDATFQRLTLDNAGALRRFATTAKFAVNKFFGGDVRDASYIGRNAVLDNLGITKSASVGAINTEDRAKLSDFESSITDKSLDVFTNNVKAMTDATKENTEELRRQARRLPGRASGQPAE